MAAYIALIRKEDATCFGVEFPDFPGCVSGGDTLDEAAQSAKEALALHVRGMQEDEEPIPAPSALEDVLASSDATGAVPMLVELAPTKGRAVRVNITIDENTLRKIDAKSTALGVTRSAFLADAARHAIEA